MVLVAGCRLQGVGCRDKGVGLKVHGSRFRVGGSRRPPYPSNCASTDATTCVQGSGFRVCG